MPQPAARLVTIGFAAALFLAAALAVGMILRWRAGKALRDQSRFLEMLLDAIPVAIFYKDRDGRYLGCNRTMAQLMGRPKADLVGRTVQEIYPLKDAEFYQQADEQLYREGGPQALEHTLVGGDHTYDMMICKAQLHDSAGRVIGVVGSLHDLTERKLAEAALRQSEERFRTTFETCPDAISISRLKDGFYIEVNCGFTDLTGWSREEVLGQSSLDIHLWDDPFDRQQLIDRLARDGCVSNFKTRFRYKSGQQATVLISSRIIQIAGETCTISVIKDIEEIRQSQELMQQSERKYRRIFDNIQDIYYESSLDGVILEISPSVERELGYRRQDLLGRNFAELYAERGERETLVDTLLASGGVNDYELRLQDESGRVRFCSINAVLVALGEGKEQRIIGSMRDITARRTAEDETRQLAYFDTLTKLPNRTLFNDRLTQALSLSKRHGDLVALLFLDLDRFKDINDSLGHSAGDLLLQHTAERLRTCVRSSDSIARLGGDEFVLLLCGIQQEREALLVAQKALRVMSAPFDLGGQEVFTSISIGIVLSPLDGQDVDVLMKHADMAMYAAKEQGRNTYKFFSKEMNRKAQERHAMESSLRRAMKQQEFFLDYQPQMDLASGRMVGVEALLRWRDPKRGLVAPDRFVPVAEESGLIHGIGEWVLRTACTQCRQWDDAGLGSIRMAVNLSGYQFKQPDFLDMVERILSETRLSPNQLEMELTESVLMEQGRETINILTDLKLRGIKLAIDDFGTGYSSLAYLKNFPIDRIKIDRSFVRDITTDPNDAAIVETIIAMGRTLGLRVMAEGVETRDQLEFLRKRRCDELQGYYLGRPMAPEKIAELLRAGLGAAGEGLLERQAEMH